jgi:invasion protein IalB
MKNTTVAVVAVVAVAALLIASTAISTSTNQAFAGKGRSVHQTSSQGCTISNPNNNARCQNNLDQIAGHDNAATVTGTQP